MSSFTEAFSDASLNSPWLAKSTGQSHYLLKYGAHPSKPGYIILLTDLSKVYFESLAGIRLVTRQKEIEERDGETETAAGESVGEEAVQAILCGLEETMGGKQWDQVEISTSAGDLYDLDVDLRSDSLSWLFHLTEIKYGALEIITKHLITPLAASVPSSSASPNAVELLSVPKILKALNSQIPGKPVQSPKPPDASRSSDQGNGEASPTGASRPFPGNKRLPRRVVRQLTESPPPAASRQGSAVPTASRSPSPTPKGKPAKRKEASPTPESPPIPTPSRRTKHPHRISESDEEEEEHKRSPQPSPAPPIASAPSQKTKKEREEEEEELLAKRREAMKKQMGAGGGGRLAKRRLGR